MFGRASGTVGINRGDYRVETNESRAGVRYHKYVIVPRYLWYSDNGPAKRVRTDEGTSMYVSLSTWQGRRGS